MVLVDEAEERSSPARSLPADNAAMESRKDANGYLPCDFVGYLREACYASSRIVDEARK
jgi:hypothetical protein